MSYSIQMRLVCLLYIPPSSPFLDPNESLSRSVMASMRKAKQMDLPPSDTL